MMRTYKELIKFQTFKERFDYLKLNGSVGKDTFGFDRWLNQRFYNSTQWKHIRDYVIIRDNGCDLGLTGNDISGKILIHHMNPISVDDIESRSQFLLDPEYLICVAHNTHNAIHYGDSDLLLKVPLQRTRNDTCPWKH